MSTTASVADVRALPFRVRPLPDEPFDSWLEAMATHYRATISEIACALGLLDVKHGTLVSATRAHAATWATQLTDAQALRLEQSTGIPAAQFHEMTRMRFARHAIRYTRSGRVASHSSVAKTGGRYCPDCLLDSGGRWRMSWQFTLGFACLRHRRLLADLCPGCGQAPRRNGHPLSEIPVLGRCHNPAGAVKGPPRTFCRTDLTSGVDTVFAPDAVLIAQRQAMRVMDSGQARFGIYASAPQPALRVFDDIRLLARVALDCEDVDIMNVADLDRSIVARARQLPGGSARTAVGYATAVAALDDPYQVVRLLRGHLGPHTVYPLCTPQLQTLIAASFGRSRRPTAFLQSAPVTEREPVERARKVPAQIWDEWLARLAPANIDREIVATALSAAIVFTGSRLTHSAALALIDPKASIQQVTRVMRAIDLDGQQTGPIYAILRLTAHLDSHDVPIDYARRRELDYRELLAETDWTRICQQLNVAPGGGMRWRLARGYLYKKLTGNRVRRIDSDLTAIEVDRFADTLPVSVRDELDRVAREFLAAQGICEPLTWTPVLDELSGAPESAIDDAGLWPAARPAFAAADDAISLEEIAVAYATGASTYELARRTGVSRQTISRILVEMSTPTRRGRQPARELDVDRIRHLYEVERLTMPQIAKVMGCSQSTISNRLRGTRPLTPPTTRQSRVIVPDAAPHDGRTPA